MRDKFGVKIKEGLNLKVLNSAKSYFMTKGIQIIRYEFTNDSSKRRDFQSLKSKDMETCCICDRSLYYIEDEGDGDPIIRRKKKLIFHSMDGEQYTTCFKLSSCFKNVGFKPNGKNDGVTRTPTFEKFINIDEEPVEQPAQDIFLAAKQSYNRCVVPFIQKWSNMVIDKNNVMEFVRSMDTLGPHLIYYETDVDKERIVDKILKMCGVKL